MHRRLRFLLPGLTLLRPRPAAAELHAGAVEPGIAAVPRGLAVPPGGRGEALLRHLASPAGRVALDAAGVTVTR